MLNKLKKKSFNGFINAYTIEYVLVFGIVPKETLYSLLCP